MGPPLGDTRLAEQMGIEKKNVCWLKWWRKRKCFMSGSLIKSGMTGKWIKRLSAFGKLLSQEKVSEKCLAEQMGVEKKGA